MIDLDIRKEQLEKNICFAKENHISLPTLAQLRIPDLIPQTVREKAAQQTAVSPFRMGWYNGEAGEYRKAPAFVEIPQEVSGVPCRILALTGDPQAGADFGCLLPKLVTGQADAAAPAPAFDKDTDMSSALWHYNITGWALADIFESQKRPGDRLSAVCFAAAEGGLTAAGDLLKARYPRAKMVVGGLSGRKDVPVTCNVRNIDVTCDGADTLACCIAVAKYFEFGEHDILLTVLPEAAAGSAEACGVKELTYPERKRLHTCRNAKDELWKEDFWAELYDQMIVLDRLVNDFNSAVVKIK